MDKNLIIEGSALLAEFLGWHKQSDTTFMVPNNYPFNYPGETEFSPDNFQFHTRWDWIIPSCKKWDSITFDTWEKVRECSKHSRLIESAVLRYDPTPVRVFYRLIDAIKWNNSVR